MDSRVGCHRGYFEVDVTTEFIGNGDVVGRWQSVFATELVRLQLVVLQYRLLVCLTSNDQDRHGPLGNVLL